jgi:phosphatidate cytidylyltransferase
VGSAALTVGGDRFSADVVKRVASAIVLIPLFVWMVSRGPAWLFVLFVAAVAGMAAWELARLFERAGMPTYARLGPAAAVAVTASFAWPGLHASAAMIALTLAAAVVLTAPVWRPGPLSFEPVATSLLGVLYVGWFLGHAVLLYRLPSGSELVLLLVGTTWVGESAAYMVGSTLGRHKLAPAISPNKTVEGAAAQVAASLLGAMILGAWLLPEWKASRILGAGVLLGVIGQIGDLAESVIKRSVGVKDTGGLIPGHGGLLDRVDGLLLNAPALYYYAALGAFA